MLRREPEDLVSTLATQASISASDTTPAAEPPYANATLTGFIPWVPLGAGIMVRLPA